RVAARGRVADAAAAVALRLRPRAPAGCVVKRSIVHVCQPTDGGAAVCVRQLADAGQQAGFDVTGGCPSDGPLAGWVEGSGARWAPLPMVRSPRPRDVRDLARLRRLAAGGRGRPPAPR